MCFSLLGSEDCKYVPFSSSSSTMCCCRRCEALTPIPQHCHLEVSLDSPDTMLWLVAPSETTVIELTLTDVEAVSADYERRARANPEGVDVNVGCVTVTAPYKKAQPWSNSIQRFGWKEMVRRPSMKKRNQKCT